MRNRYRVFAAIVLVGALSGATGAAPTSRVALMELYTSEGCNSCPPMDMWVSRLPRPQFVPQKLVVLAFHVDYWNYLGWPDRFSQAGFTQRQHRSVRNNGLRTAYTPQLLLNGRDYRERGDIDTQVSRINAQTTPVHLALVIKESSPALKASVLVKPQTKLGDGPVELYVAVYENNLQTQVQAGENRGQQLRHDYVVRSLIGPMVVAPNEPTRWEGTIPLRAEWKRADLGLAVFVQSESGEVLQATARPIRDLEF